MNYEKEYKEAIKRAKAVLEIAANKEEAEGYVSTIFPELKENEDERIRKAIIGYIDHGQHYGVSNKDMISWLKKQGEQDMIPLNKVIKFLDEQLVNDKDEVTGEPFINFLNYGAFKETFISYFKRKMLEKQGEQKPILDFKAADWYVSKVDGKIHNIHQSVDKVEPKFKVGDWVMLDRPVLITKVVDMPYNTHQYWTSDGTWFGDATKAKLWTIQDAKDGDVLAFDNDIIVIFKDLYNAYTFHSYCYIQDRVFDTNEGSVPAWWKAEHFYPATKEQRDQLEKAMINAGYEWNAEKKELEHKNE